MSNVTRILFGLAVALLATAAGAHARVQRYADPGDVRLESGDVLRDCRVGSRLVGAPNATDKIRKAQAMLAPDVAAPLGGSLERAARAVQAKVLGVVADPDDVVTPGPAREVAKPLDVPLVELAEPCGHLAPGCESATLDAAMKAFLAQ